VRGFSVETTVREGFCYVRVTPTKRKEIIA
jgi:hypothetical protein